MQSILDQRKNAREYDLYFQANVYFYTEKVPVVPQEISVARILLEFFFFYVFIFNPEEYVIDVPRGCFTPKDKVKVDIKLSPPFSIIDPFDIHHNPGKTLQKDHPNYLQTIRAMIKCFHELALKF